MEHALLHGLCAALAGFAFAHVMADSISPFGWYFDLLGRLNRYDKRYKYITYPLGGCSICFSGQLALWTAWYQLGFELSIPVACSVLTSAGAAITIVYVLNEIVLWLKK